MEETEFSTHIFNHVKRIFADNYVAEPTIFHGKVSFSLNLLSGHFMGNPALRLFKVLKSIHYA